MEKLTISAQTRQSKLEKIRKLKKSGYIPGVVYGLQVGNRTIKINKKDFKKVFSMAGESALIDLEIDDKQIGKVIINDYQLDPVSDDIIHVDLYQVRMDKKIEIKIPIIFKGEAPAVKNKSGVLIKNHDKIELKCLPGDLIHNIEIDLSGLDEIDKSIRVKDLKFSDKIEIMMSPEEVIAIIASPREEEKPEETAVEDIEKVGDVKEKKEEEKKEGEEEKKEGDEKKPSPQTKEKK